jgi:hypothetical protein
MVLMCVYLKKEITTQYSLKSIIVNRTKFKTIFLDFSGFFLFGQVWNALESNLESENDLLAMDIAYNSHSIPIVKKIFE